MEEKKTFVGNGKKKFENLRSVSICLTDLAQEHIFEYNGKKYIKLNVHDKKEADQYGKDVNVSIDTWKPNTTAPISAGINDSLPF
jgi:hypothetical protein